MRPYYLFCILLTIGCSGYKWQNKENPFAQYNVYSIYVPMFYNKTAFPNVSAAFTKEIVFILNSFSGLKIVNSIDDADAVFLGIVHSQREESKAILNKTPRLAKSVALENIGKRDDFSIPLSSSLDMMLEVRLIRNPTPEILAIAKSEIGQSIDLGSKEVFRENIYVNSTFAREYFEGEAAVVSGTQNRGALKVSVKQLAVSAANNFRDMVLYAF